MTIKVKRLRSGAKLPTRAYDQALAYDVYFCPEDNRPETLMNGRGPKLLGTGIAIQPPQGYGFIVRERGSMGMKGLSIRAGVIDEDYRAEVFILMQLINQHINIQTNTGFCSTANYTMHPGDKIAQLILIPTPTHAVVEVNQLSDTERDEQCLGSSDK